VTDYELYSVASICVENWGGRRSEARSAEAEVGFLGRGSYAPSLPARESGERCKLPQCGPGEAPAAADFGAF